MVQKALAPPSERGRHMVSYPPGPATVSRAFLHEDDDCWVALTSADDATENLMKIEKFCQRANCHQKVSRWRRDTLGKGRRSRRGQSRRRWRQRWRSWRRQRQGEMPCHRRRQLAIAKGADVSRLVSHAWLSVSKLLVVVVLWRCWLGCPHHLARVLRPDHGEER